MAIRLRQAIKINPVDLTEKTAVGVKLPFNKKRIFNLDYTTKDHAKSKLINTLLTVPGERINQPFFGVGLRQEVFNQITEETTESLKSKIHTQVRIYVPEINIRGLRFKDDPTNHILYLTINYEVIANSEEDSVTLSFNNSNFENDIF